MNDWLDASVGLRLRDPAFLWLFVLLPLLIFARRARGAAAVQFAPAVFTTDLPGTARTKLASLPIALHVLGICLAILALTRPVHRIQLPRESQGVDVLLLVDVSSSMLAKDMDKVRSRLDLTKDAAAAFIASRPDDRIGLIRFARYPDVLCPPTLDHGALTSILRGVMPVLHDGPEDLTGIGTAVARAAQVLRSSAAKSRVAVLLTDGEENVATSRSPDELGPGKAARLCEEFGVRVYTIVVGIGNADPSGAMQPLDTQAVEALARTTGGQFFIARDAGAMAAVYANIDTLERAQFETPRFQFEDRFIAFLLAGIACVLLGRLLAAGLVQVLP